MPHPIFTQDPEGTVIPVLDPATFEELVEDLGSGVASDFFREALANFHHTSYTLRRISHPAANQRSLY